MKHLIRLFGLLMLLVCKATLADVTFVHTDALGSPVAETNSAGQLVRLSHYNPFGEELEQKKDDVAYTGHKYDAELALSYMQARYYDPVIGRFYSNDPIGFRDVHSFNRYAYANNNPYKYVDLDGMAPNRAGVTTIASLRAEIRGYEKSGLKGAAVMSALSRNHGGNANRYLFTDKHG
jgi:RHS repeat-associated protein